VHAPPPSKEITTSLAPACGLIPIPVAVPDAHFESGKSTHVQVSAGAEIGACAALASGLASVLASAEASATAAPEPEKWQPAVAASTTVRRRIDLRPIMLILATRLPAQPIEIRSLVVSLGTAPRYASPSCGSPARSASRIGSYQVA